MKPQTKEWIQKAEGDFIIAGRAYRTRTVPVYDGVCFHTQQCLEKYLKARLCEAGIEIPKTHDLSALLDSVLPVEPLWEPFRPILEDLTSYAVAFRYPGETADKEIAHDALKKCRGIRIAIREFFGLVESPRRRRKRR